MDKEEKGLITPPSPTTNCVQKCIKKSWYQSYPPPFVILAFSFIQIIIFLIDSKSILTLFRFNPNRQIEIWRFITYMFIHDDCWHLLINITVQSFLAILLEQEQGGIRVGVVYLVGGGFGALGAACVRADIVVGASAGGYALLTSHLSNILLRYKHLTYTPYRLSAILLMLISDVTYSTLHIRSKGRPVISEGAHVVGALSGVLLGLIVFKGSDGRFLKFMFGLSCLVILAYVLLVVNYQIRRCTPKELLNIKYIYLC